jgi:hypothetical protein
MAGKSKSSVEAEEGVATATPSFSLPRKKVKVIPVMKKGWLPKGHEAEFLYKHSVNTYTVPKSSLTGVYINPLSVEEVEFLESHPGLSVNAGDLSVHKKDNNFWRSIFKPIRLSKDERTLDLSDPMDYITYKVLLLNKDSIAPDAESINNKASYKYAIVELDYEDNKRSNTANLMTDAYVEYSKFREDRQTLSDVLFLLKSQRVPLSASLTWLQGQVGDFISVDPGKFLKVVRDPNLQTRLLITKGLTYNAIQKDGTAYRTIGGDLMGVDLSATIAFLNNKQNSDHRILIEAMVARSEGK